MNISKEYFQMQYRKLLLMTKMNRWMKQAVQLQKANIKNITQKNINPNRMNTLKIIDNYISPINQIAEMQMGK